MLRELWETVVDAVRTGDLLAHLRAWWQVARGQVTAEMGAEAVLT